MIKNKKDLKNYIDSDLKSLDAYPITIKMRVNALIHPEIWKFQEKLRVTEYLKNTMGNSILRKIYYKYKYINLVKYGYKLGFSIPLNVCGPGLCLCHVGTVIINENARIGSNARIHADVNIGNSSRLGQEWTANNVPIIGDNVYIGPGAKLFGKITVGNNVAIGANAVVTKNIPDHVTVAGIPASIINNRGSQGMLIYGWKKKK